jgi:hypothetical protein
MNFLKIFNQIKDFEKDKAVVTAHGARTVA